MKLLLDTQVLLWAVAMPIKLPKKTRLLLEDLNTTLIFSAASLWEISIKRSLNRPNFQFDTRMLRRELVERGYQELPVTSEHAVHTENLAPHHKDPFDRILIAQANVEGITLLTANSMIARYGASVRKI